MEPSAQHVETHTGHVVVVGGGIAGLAAAHRLLGAGIDVTLLEATDRLGGKLYAGEIEGAPVDLGAESMLARRPEAVELARAVGLGGLIQPPATATASVWTRGELRPMPKGHVMGVPGDPAALTGLLSEEGLARIAREAELAPTEIGDDDDVSVGAFVAERLGREVVDRLVEPLLGGVYAGDAYRISMKSAVPQLFEALRSHDSLLGSVRALQAAAAAAARPAGAVFAGIEGGVGRLPGAVADAVRAGGGRIRMESPVLGLTRTADEWRIRTDRDVLAADGVVLAAPAWSASALLADESPAASAGLAEIEYASMALVTMAFRRSDADMLPEGSGFLVPPVDGHTIKASTFSTRKWRWVAESAPGLFLLRTSIGRYGEEERVHQDDADLVGVSLRDLAEATGLRARPVAAEVTRWIDGLPQYPVGHQVRVARIREAVAKLPGLRLCGAPYDGVGIPACVASAHRAADEIIATSTLAWGTGRGAGE
ncbi:protoporphyrinogen oxidase [Streptomyces lushanensis]|uniref:protoporphyrinogen oxidase n=1 Tax=Streptomyces lushanensis TaxID=1434255 RepID=UPI000829D385|nr:protoporphyrinogen oxidase [Streptomyces lushanensis]